MRRRPASEVAPGTGAPYDRIAMPGPHDMTFMKALAANRKGDAAGARALLESVLAEEPDHTDSLEVLGMILSEQGELERAIEVTERLVGLAPSSIMAHANLSRYHMLKGDKETAEEWQAKARTLGWKEEIARKGAAAGTAATERPVDPDVVEKQEAMIGEHPDDVMTRLALAKNYIKLEMPIKAVGHLREALKHDPKLSVLYLELGKALEAANLAADAVPVYTSGIPVADKNGDLMPRNQMQSRLADLQKKAAKHG
jgi:tetratricopeptide (TPR) repeat protein